MLISVTAVLTGECLDPKEISEILRITPHFSTKKGDLRISPVSKNEAVSKTGLWEWRSRDPSESIGISAHIARLKKAFETVGHSLATLPNVESAWIDIHVVVGDEGVNVSTASLLVDVESISALNSLGLPVEVTMDILPST